ncbi:MAG: hypothetical protein RLZZ158_1970 [Cyanobacteriota bacterium]
MARRADTPIWVQGLRTKLRSTLGPAFRIGEQRGRTKLDVRSSTAVEALLCFLFSGYRHRPGGSSWR